ncbi:carboxypeptidase N-like protein precursor [Nasonia vitripennis]|uniref:Uncharacterized protein n=1 Tax=Nasonia vitripennis TaxID=7425 RepID=A0A7M6W5T0_NASVI|nr:carboxypeptidase N-like protein precursor [Nasonia vitripennis]
MKTTLLLLFAIIAIGHCQDSTYFLEPKSEETDYDLICNDHNISINFSELSLNTIKKQFLSSPIITCLDLSSNQIESVDHNAFLNLPNLKYLNMNGNAFKLQDIFAYNHMNLETLLLDNNERLPNDYYGYEGYTSNYYYSDCIHRGMFGQGSNTMYEARIHSTYPKLKKLFIRNHKTALKFTADSKANFPSLTHLHLSGSTIAHDNFDWLPNSLQYLDLSGHSLNSFSLRDLKNLKWIYLDNPASKCLSKVNFKNLINLKYLSLPSNNFNRISHETFAGLASLEFLDLSDNNIRYVEEGCFNSMQNLQFLNLSTNNIEIIQGSTFDKLKNLQTLILKNNLISKFPIIYNEMKLKMLSLSCNYLKTIVRGTFAKMPYLEILHLHGNEITYIDQEAFAGLKNLRILTLSDNKLTSLPNNWLLPMINLERLDLSNNYIIDFGYLALSDSSPLQYLYLSNQLEIVRSISLLENVPENVTISLKANDTFVEKCVKEDENVTDGEETSRKAKRVDAGLNRGPRD